MIKQLIRNGKTIAAPLIINQPVQLQAVGRERRIARPGAATPRSGLGVRWDAACVIFPGFEPSSWCLGSEGTRRRGEG
jgi:hypothetical protein